MEELRVRAIQPNGLTDYSPNTYGPMESHDAGRGDSVERCLSTLPEEFAEVRALRRSLSAVRTAPLPWAKVRRASCT